MLRIVIAAALTTFSIVVNAAPVSEMKNYSGPWLEDADIEIIKSIAWNKVGGCGDLRYRRNKFDRDRFLVRCVGRSPVPKFYEVFVKDHSVKKLDLEE